MGQQVIGLLGYWDGNYDAVGCFHPTVNDFIKPKFAWQGGYGVLSVSPSQVQKVRDYIKNQEEHHRKMTYQEEVEKFMVAYGIQFNK